MLLRLTFVPSNTDLTPLVNTYHFNITIYEIITIVIH